MGASVKYPEVTVKLIGQDSNAFMLIAAVRTALRRAGVPSDEIEEFTKEAMSGDYNHVLNTIQETVRLK